jgi:hypothetical protein
MRRPKYFAYRDAIMCSTLTQSEKDVLHAILKHMSFRPDARPPCPGETRLGLLASVGERTVRRALKSLEAAGVLQVKRVPLRTSTYRIVYARLLELAHPGLTKEQRAPAGKISESERGTL